MKKLCENYHATYEDGCCMETCIFYDINKCPVVIANQNKYLKRTALKLIKENKKLRNKLEELEEE